MSAIGKRKSVLPPEDAEDDLFRYGWRYVRRVLPDGTVNFDQVPLTLEDILHPEEEDFRVHSDAHNDDCAYLKQVIRQRLPRDGVVLSDCRVSWGVRGLRAHGPDIVVFRGVRRRRDWRTFYVAQEGARPLLVIEITSPDTRQTDLVNKVDHYHRAGVPLYVIVDAVVEEADERQLEPIGYRHTPSGYERFAPDERGWLWLEPVGLWLGVEGTRVYLYDPSGNKIVIYSDVEGAREAEAQARAEAETRAKDEAKARKAAEQRIRELEAELRSARKKKPAKKKPPRKD